jgi:hypothetical protein
MFNTVPDNKRGEKIAELVRVKEIYSVDRFTSKLEDVLILG